MKILSYNFQKSIKAFLFFILILFGGSMTIVAQSGTTVKVSSPGIVFTALNQAGDSLFSIKSDGRVMVYDSSGLFLPGLVYSNSTDFLVTGADGRVEKRTLASIMQTLSISGNVLSISGGNSVTIDGSATNELQTLSISGNSLSISNGNTVAVDGSPTNEIQTLSVSGGDLSISNGNTVALPDSDSTNEIQILTRVGDSASLSKNGGFISIKDADSDATNEIQILARVGDSASLSNGGSISIKDGDADATNEWITNFVLNGTILEAWDAGGQWTVDLGNLPSNGSNPTDELIDSLFIKDSLLIISEGGKFDTVDLAPIMNDGDWKQNGNDIYNDKSGNTGIGTNSPTSKLHVVDIGYNMDFIKIQHALFPNDFFSITQGGQVPGMAPFIQSHQENYPGPSLTIQASTSVANDIGVRPLMQWRVKRGVGFSQIINRPAYQWKNANASLVTISANGNVGMGIDSAEANLHISGTGVLLKVQNKIFPSNFLEIIDGTSGPSFYPVISAHQEDMDIPSLLVSASTSAANDTSSVPLLEWRVVKGQNQLIQTRPLFQWTNRNYKYMTMSANGYLGIGTTTPGARLSVAGNICASGTITATSATCLSDLRFKKDIIGLKNALEKVILLQGVSYNFRNEEFPEREFSNTKQIGLIAQEVEKVFPEFVFTHDDGYKSVEYAKITAVLIEAIKEQQTQFESLQAENAALKQTLAKIDARLQAVESFTASK